MNERCLKCGICCKYIPANIELKTIFRDGIQIVDEEFINNLVLNANIDTNYCSQIQMLFPEIKFYKCKFLSEQNLCTNETKPEICKNFPASSFSFIPDNCGYLGEFFSKQEEIKQKIRKLKEEIIHYEALINSNHKDKNNYQKIINAHQKFIDKYKIFGSENW